MVPNQYSEYPIVEICVSNYPIRKKSYLQLCYNNEIFISVFNTNEQFLFNQYYLSFSQIDNLLALC